MKSVWVAYINMGMGDGITEPLYAFSTKKKAEAFNKYGKYTLEEVPLDPEQQ